MATYAGGQAWGRLLASGEISDVYWGKLDGWEVAVKRFKPAAPPSDRQRATFEATCRRLPRVQSRHVAALVGYCAEEGAAVYEFVAGQTLEGRLFGGGGRDAMAWRERVRAVHGAAEGLAALHAAGVSHGDLHPGSIVVTPGGAGVLVGWGGDLLGEALLGPGTYHARVMVRNDAKGWAFCAPEVVHKAPALLSVARAAVGPERRLAPGAEGGGGWRDLFPHATHPRDLLPDPRVVDEPRTDVFALGVVIWEVLQGKRLVDTLWVQEARSESAEALAQLREEKRVAWEMRARRRSRLGTLWHYATLQFLASPGLREAWVALGFEAPDGQQVEYTVVPKARTLAALDEGWREYGAARGLADPAAGAWDHEGVRYLAHAACQCLHPEAARRPSSAALYEKLAFPEAEFRVPWYGAVIRVQRLLGRVVRGVLYVFEALLSVFLLALALPRLGLRLLALSLRALGGLLGLAAGAHGLLVGALDAGMWASGAVRGGLMGVGVEYRLPQVLLAVAAGAYVLGKAWARYAPAVEDAVLPAAAAAGRVLWSAHAAAAAAEGVVRRLAPGLLGGYTVFQTGEAGNLGLVPATEPLRRALRLP